MELAKGYKQTEIGLIPEDWEIIKLRECLIENPKYGIGAAAVEYNLNYPKYLRITDIGDEGGLRKDGFKSVNHIDSNNYFLKEGDLVFARTGASVGKSYLYDINDGLLVYAGFLIKISPNNSVLKSQFLKAFVSTKTYWRWVTVMSMRSGQPGINSNEYGNIQIPLPPLPEQQAIAGILSDTDNFINALAQQLDKKRAIKQGAMQALLMPKEDWEVKTLGEVLKFGNGKDYKHLKSGSIPVFGTGGIMTFVNDYLFDGESIGIGRKGTIDKPIFLRGKFWTVDTLFFTHSFKNSNPKYIYYQFQLIKWKDYNEASGVPSLNKKTLEQIEIRIPPIEEQTRIATVLTDMDLEIAQLEEKLAKYKVVKQGLMQQLLTGKIRVI